MNTAVNTSRRVLVLAKAYPPNLGGVETYSEQVASAYARAGFATTVLTQFDGPLGRMKTGKIKVINVGPGPQWLVFARLLRELWRQRRIDFACVHATTWRVAIPAILAGRNPLIVTAHGREVAQTGMLLRPLMREVFRRCRQILVISNYAREVCSAVVPGFEKRAVVAWNGISWPEEAPRQTSGQPPFRILTACQLTQRKNVAAAVGALARLMERGIDGVQLEIAGDGPERQSLERLAQELKISGNVTFLGFVPRARMPAVYRRADLFLHPQSHAHDSRDFESFCIAVADALAFGLPTIAGRHGAPSEYITHDQNGWLVEGDDTDEIARLIEVAVTNSERARVMGARARAFAVAEFSWDKHISPVLQLINT